MFINHLNGITKIEIDALPNDLAHVMLAMLSEYSAGVSNENNAEVGE